MEYIPQPRPRKGCFLFLSTFARWRLSIAFFYQVASISRSVVFRLLRERKDTQMDRVENNTLLCWGQRVKWHRVSLCLCVCVCVCAYWFAACFGTVGQATAWMGTQCDRGNACGGRLWWNEKWDDCNSMINCESIPLRSVHRSYQSLPVWGISLFVGCYSSGNQTNGGVC